jgi:AAA domain
MMVVRILTTTIPWMGGCFSLAYWLLLLLMMMIFLLESNCHGLQQASGGGRGSTTPRGRRRLFHVHHANHNQHLDPKKETHPYVPIWTVDTYVRHWEELLFQEHRAAVDDLKLQQQGSSSSSSRRWQANGISLRGVSAEPDSELFGEKIVRIFRPRGNQYSNGNNNNNNNKNSNNSLRDFYSTGDVLVMATPDTDSVSRKHQRRRYHGFKTTMTSMVPRDVCVVDVGTDWLTASVGSSWPPGLWESRKHVGFYQVQLDRTVPKATLLAQKKALDLVRRGKAGIAADLLVQSFLMKSQHQQHLQQHDNATEILASQSPSWLQKASSTKASLTDAINAAIQENSSAGSSSSRNNNWRANQSQRDAIAWALNRRLSLIRGPPGTGKTACAAKLIVSAISLGNSQNKKTRVLSVAHSNGAADVLLQALLDQGVPAVRLGRPASVGATVRHRTIVAMAEQHPAVLELRRAAMETTLEPFQRSAARHEVVRCIHEIRRMIANTASVVVTSCVGAHQLFTLTDHDDSADDNHHDCRFHMVVLDEAAQTTEPALLCALAAARAEQIVMVGDTRQLPPTVAGDSVELRESLGVSPMARLEGCGVGQQTLRVQYRMSPALLQFPSRYFYQGHVICADDVSVAVEPPSGFPWPKGQPIAFIDTGGANLEVTHDRGGKSNPSEAALVVQIVNSLLAAADGDIHIAVISPYLKQVQLIRTLLSASGLRGCEGVRTGTVDSFQGQETDVVVFSSVRSNGMNELGFVRDPRRLCVALTRARRGLVIVGNPRVLQTSRPWEALLLSCQDRGCMMTPKDLGIGTMGAVKVTEADEEKVEQNAMDFGDAALLAALEASLANKGDEMEELLDTLFGTATVVVKDEPESQHPHHH